MSKWLLVVLLCLQVHFAASYLVPLDAASQREFSGLLRWAWPWAAGDSGLLGQMTVDGGFPLGGFFPAVSAGGVLALAALAVAGIWVPVGWWRVFSGVGSVLLLVLMALFFGPTKLLPMAFALTTIYVAASRPTLFETG